MNTACSDGSVPGPDNSCKAIHQSSIVAAAPVQDVLARFKEQHSDFNELPSKAVFTMNDTHPTIAVAELMRLLIDQEGLDWDNAWAITTKVIRPYMMAIKIPVHP